MKRASDEKGERLEVARRRALEAESASERLLWTLVRYELEKHPVICAGLLAQITAMSLPSTSEAEEIAREAIERAKSGEGLD